MQESKTKINDGNKNNNNNGNVPLPERHALRLAPFAIWALGASR